MSFEKLLLAEPISRALQEKNYTSPTPIQREAIPVILRGSDVVGCAQTGSGKTAAFALPILHHICSKPVELKPKQFRTLVLAPTRELSIQVANNFSLYGKYLNLKVEVICGGMPMNEQIRRLMQGPDVVVATPGRLLDLYQQGKIDFHRVDHLVLDEVDRMLDMGFVPDVKRIIKQIPTTRQTLCFSATLTPTIASLVASITRDPVHIAVDTVGQTAENVDDRVCFIRNQDKFELLYHLLESEKRNEKASKTLIFTSTKQGADHLVDRLRERGIRAAAMHGDKAQRIREKVLEMFKVGTSPIMVATDVAARGIDVKNIEWVINYDLPKESDSYVHRVGRTARAGASGCAVSLCAEFDLTVLRAIELHLRKSITVWEDQPYHHEGLAVRYRSLSSGTVSVATSPNHGLLSNRKRSNRRARPSSGPAFPGSHNPG